MRKETAEKCKFIAGLFFFGGKKADIIRSSNESRPKLRNEIKQQDKKIKSEDERMKKKVVRESCGRRMAVWSLAAMMF